MSIYTRPRLRAWPHFITQVFFLLLLPIGRGPNALGQTNTSPHWDVGTSAGPLLPSNMFPVNSLIFMSGLRVATGLGAFRPEMNFLNGKSYGTDFYMLYLSFRNRIASLESDFLEPFWLVGINYSRYKFNISAGSAGGADFTSDQVSDGYLNRGGWHFGVGTYFKISDQIRIRQETYIAIRPGRTLYFGLGVEWRIPRGESASP